MATVTNDIPPTIDRFDALFDCFVINLKRQPERLHTFRQRNNSLGINIHHFEAVDGAQSAAVDVLDRIVARGAVNYGKGPIGCAMSHLALWRLCVERNKPLVVFEDDSIIRHDLKAQLIALTERVVDWDFILLGYNTDCPLDASIAPGLDFYGMFPVRYPTAEQLAGFAQSSYPVGLAQLNLALGTCGYAVAPTGAEQLIRHCFPMDNRPVHSRAAGQAFWAYGIDCMMATVYKTIRAFICVPPLVMTPNEQKTSTTKGYSTQA